MLRQEEIGEIFREGGEQRDREGGVERRERVRKREAREEEKERA